MWGVMLLLASFFQLFRGLHDRFLVGLWFDLAGSVYATIPPFH